MPNTQRRTQHSLSRITNPRAPAERAHVRMETRCENCGIRGRVGRVVHRVPQGRADQRVERWVGRQAGQRGGMVAAVGLELGNAHICGPKVVSGDGRGHAAAGKDGDGVGAGVVPARGIRVVPLVDVLDYILGVCPVVRPDAGSDPVGRCEYGRREGERLQICTLGWIKQSGRVTKKVSSALTN